VKAPRVRIRYIGTQPHAIRDSMESFWVRFWASAAATTGYKSAAATTGNYSAAATTGYYSAAATTGNYSAAATTGYYSAAATTGYYSAAATTGENSIACSLGGGLVKASHATGAIVGTWWDGARTRVRVGYIGEDGIEPGIWYQATSTGFEAVRDVD
jgi:hypothetical protein